MAEEIRRDGGEAAALAGDVTADDFPACCVKAAVDKFGTIDILVNNAGARSLARQCQRAPSLPARLCMAPTTVRWLFCHHISPPAHGSFCS